MISWDTETTGVGPKDHIVSLAAVRYTTRGRETGSFYRLIRPEGYTHMPEGAYNVHKISYEQACAEGVPFEQAYVEFQEFCGGDAHFVAYNSQFDERMMFAAIVRHNLDKSWFLNHTFSCAFELYKHLHCTKKGKLERVYVDVFGQGFDAHNALADARAAGELYFHLCNKRSVGRRVFQVQGMPCVTLNASDCATAIGKSFDDPQDVVKTLWARYHPSTFTQTTVDQRVKDMARTQDDVRRLIVDVKKFHTHSSNVLQQKIEHVQRVIDDKALPEDERVILRKYATSELQKKFARSDWSWNLETCTLPVCSIAGTDYRVCGRPGEIRDGVLFVVKNRTRRFMGVRDYEEVQCRVYLEMCPSSRGSVTTCCVVEKFQGESRFHTIERDLEKWDDIKVRLHNFFEHFHSVVSAAAA